MRKLSAQEQCRVDTVKLWRERFAAVRLSGLFSRIVDGNLEPETRPPCAHHGLDLASQTWVGATQWSTRALARALAQIRRAWRELASVGLQPHRLRRYMAGDDRISTKAADIVGLSRASAQCRGLLHR